MHMRQTYGRFSRSGHSISMKAANDVTGPDTDVTVSALEAGTLRQQRTIGEGRRVPRHVMFQAAQVAVHHSPSLKSFANRLSKAGQAQQVIISAVARMNRPGFTGEFLVQ